MKKMHFMIIVLIIGFSFIAFPLAFLSGQPPQIVVTAILTSVGATIVATVVSLILGKKLKGG